jgi:hypothetical protein
VKRQRLVMTGHRGDLQNGCLFGKTREPPGQ